MSVNSFNPFPPEALDANRRGALSDAQRRGFGALSRYRRRSALSSAAFLVAGALLVIFFASPTSSPALRAFAPLVCLAIAAFLVARSITGGDSLTRDLRESRVQSIEGAIGKRRLSGGRSVGSYFLDVGDKSFRVASGTYDAAPDAGVVRLYFLPLSRKVVNLERLANPSSPEPMTPQGIAGLLRQAIRSHSRPEANEARAELAGIGEALNARFLQSPVVPPPHTRDPRPLREAIIGTWTSGFVSVTFAADGKLRAHTLGAQRDGHWSVDGTGHLCADLTGERETADAWVVGNQLTIAAEDGGMTFTREDAAR